MLHTVLMQLERYKELKELARKKGAVLNQSAEKLHWEVKADCEKLQFDLRRKSEIQVGFSLSATSWRYIKHSLHTKMPQKKENGLRCNSF